MPMITINVNVPAIIKRDGDVFDAFCPALDVASQGCTEVEAKKNLTEAVTLFLGTCIEMGILTDVLKQCGLKPANGKICSTDEKNFEHIDIPLPYFAAEKNRECHA